MQDKSRQNILCKIIMFWYRIHLECI